MEQIWLDVCCRDPTKPGQPDARIFELAVAFGRGFREDQWRAVDHGSEFLERFVTKRRDRKAALKFLRKTMKRHGNPHSLVTDKLRSYGAAMKVVGNADKQETGRWLNNRAENSHQPFRRRERAMIRFRRMRTLQKFVAVHATMHRGEVPQCPGTGTNFNNLVQS